MKSMLPHVSTFCTNYSTFIILAIDYLVQEEQFSYLWHCTKLVSKHMNICNRTQGAHCTSGLFTTNTNNINVLCIHYTKIITMEIFKISHQFCILAVHFVNALQLSLISQKNH
jgi:hypothetical protein